MNNARVNGKNRELPPNTNSTGLPSPLLFLILKRWSPADLATIDSRGFHDDL
ncbi:MAG: hypothetical protein ABI856_09105 [Nitrospira sp.]